MRSRALSIWASSRDSKLAICERSSLCSVAMAASTSSPTDCSWCERNMLMSPASARRKASRRRISRCLVSLINSVRLICASLRLPLTPSLYGVQSISVLADLFVHGSLQAFGLCLQPFLFSDANAKPTGRQLDGFREHGCNRCATHPRHPDYDEAAGVLVRVFLDFPNRFLSERNR